MEGRLGELDTYIYIHTYTHTHTHTHTHRLEELASEKEAVDALCVRQVLCVRVRVRVRVRVCVCVEVSGSVWYGV